MRTGSIYIIKNTVNDRVYIGQTTMTVHERFMTHMKPSTSKLRRNYKLYNAVLKHGRDKFYVETLEVSIPISEINEKEIRYISYYDSYNNGYNSTKGGDGRIINLIDNEEELLSLAKQGIGVKELALKFKVNGATILRTLHKLGFTYITEISKDTLVDLINKGKTNVEIAKILKVHKYTITRHLDKYGLNRYNKKIPNRSDFDLNGLIIDYNNQMPISEILQKYNLTQTTFYRVKSENNLSSRPQIYKNKIRYHD